MYMCTQVCVTQIKIYIKLHFVSRRLTNTHRRMNTLVDPCNVISGSGWGWGGGAPMPSEGSMRPDILDQWKKVDKNHKIELPSKPGVGQRFDTVSNKIKFVGLFFC